jgi:H+/gluconate symporter-like permease
MAGNIGVIAGLVLLILFALRGVNIFIASVLSAAVVAVSNSQSLAHALSVDYTQSMMGFAGAFFLLFMAGAVFGRVMGESQAAASVAFSLARGLGAQHTLMIGMGACAVLTYGGVNVFIVIFAVYPLGLGLMQQANIPKRLFLAATSLGAGTFTMTALPGSPSIHNNISASALGTPLTAGPWLGLLATAVMLVLGVLYLNWQQKVAERRGEQFVPAASDVLPEKDPDISKMPLWTMATIPLAVVVATILLPPMVGKAMGISAPPAGSEEEAALSGFDRMILFSQHQSILWTSFALVLATLVALVLFRKTLGHPFAAVSSGAESCILPLMNTSAVIGFGGVVKATPVFDTFSNVMIDANIHPLISAALSINIISGIVGSASGGLGIFMQTLGPHYLEMGISPERLHRVVTIAAGGLDSLPHCGAVITSLTIMGLTHKEAYKDVAVITVLVPLAATCMVLAAAILMG